MPVRDLLQGYGSEWNRKKEDLDKGQWTFEVRDGHGVHNHPPLTTSTLAFVRRLDDKQKDELQKLFGRGLGTKECMRTMADTYPELKMIARDVWLQRYQYRAEQRGGNSAIEAAVLRMREEQKNIFRIWRDDDGTMQVS